jgi:60 kDa SS-A/Ro ribonucleoprotein
MAIRPRLIVVGMTSNGFTIADRDDAGTVDVVGFDSAVPSVMADFVRD